MGRGNRSDEGAAAPPRQRTARRELSPQERALVDARYFIGRYEHRIDLRMRSCTATTQQAREKAKIDAIGLLSAPEQRRLVQHIRAAETAGTPEAAKLGERGRELMILANSRFIQDYASKHEGRGAPMESVLQACRLGMNKAIDTYDPDRGAGFLHWSANQMHGALNDVIEHEAGPVRMKSKATLHHSRVQQVIKDLDNEGRRVSIDEVTDILNKRFPNARYTPQRVAEVYDWAAAGMISLDATVDAAEGGANLGSVIADAAAVTEENALNAAQRQAVRRALNAIQSPVDRKVMELYWGLDGREQVEQKDMFNGVYRDAEGNAFSAEDSVINDRAELGEAVSKLGQKELDVALRDNAVTFEPGTPEARELFETFGAPPTSGTIQYSLKRAREQMAAELEWMRDDFRYRGDNELENSDAAQEEVRRALVSMGHFSAADARKLKVSRPGRDGTVRKKGPLRQAAEQYGLVDERGRVRLDKVPAPVGAPPAAPARASMPDSVEEIEDYASMMSTV